MQQLSVQIGGSVGWITDNSGCRVPTEVQVGIGPINGLVPRIDDPIHSHVVGTEVEADRGGKAIRMAATNRHITEAAPDPMKGLIGKIDSSLTGMCGPYCSVQPVGTMAIAPLAARSRISG